MVKKVDFDLIWIQRLHFLVQTEIRLALEEFCGYGVVRAGGQFNPANVLRTTMHIHQSAVWMIFQCHLLGVGTRANPGLALDILFTSGIKENGGYWKSWVLTGLLYAALEIPVPRDRIVQIGAGGLLSSYASLFYAKMTDTELMNNKPSADSHGIDCSKDELADVWSTWTNSGETSGRVRDRPALNSTFIRDRRTGGGNTMLHAAALYDLTDLARFLTRQEEPLVDINAVNDSHETALIIACRWNSYDIIHLLLDNGADASITDERGENGLYWLSSLPEQSAEHTARRLVEHGAKLHVCSDEAWESTDLFPDSYFYDCRTKAGPSGPLVRAVANRDMYSLRVLLKLYNERSEEIGSENKWAGVFTAFHPALRIAAELHLYQIAELICKEMHDALQGLLPPPVPRSIVGYMIVKFIKSSAVIRGVLRMTHHVHRLCLHGKHWRAASSRTLELLHEYGIVGSQVFANGSWIRTLNFAIACGNHEAVVTLLDLPEFLAAIDEVDEVFHIPPLHQALNSQQLDILRLLIVKGATVDLRKGREPEHNLTAVEASYLHVVASLRIDDLSFANTILEHGVPADIADNRGCTAFSLAVNRGAFGLARLLIENGVDLRTPGYLGVTPLGEAMFGSNVRQCDDWIATVK
jgi:ankyrin repeat protein